MSPDRAFNFSNTVIVGGVAKVSNNASCYFDGASYFDRGEQLCLRLLRQRLYDGCAFLLSDAEHGVDGEYWEPQDELTFRRFAGSLVGHIMGYLEFQGTTQERF